MYFGTLTDIADNVQLYKYAVLIVTNSFGKSATFMPKPVKKEITAQVCIATNQFGMEVHHYLWVKSMRFI